MTVASPEGPRATLQLIGVVARVCVRRRQLPRRHARRHGAGHIVQVPRVPWIHAAVGELSDTPEVHAAQVVLLLIIEDRQIRRQIATDAGFGGGPRRLACAAGPVRLLLEPAEYEG